MRQCKEFIRKAELGELQLQPGCDMATSLEAKLSSELSRIRETAGQYCREALVAQRPLEGNDRGETEQRHNPALIMALCGSKGSLLNISQMVMCVGQQVDCFEVLFVCVCVEFCKYYNL